MSRWWRGLGHDRRVLVLVVLAGLPGVAVALGFLWLEPIAPRIQWTVSVVLLGAWVGLTAAVREHVVRPLGTLANMLAALREGDFSIRARVDDADDPLSLAYLEVNNLEEKTGDVEAEFNESALRQLKNGENTLAVMSADVVEELSLCELNSSKNSPRTRA